MGFNLQKNPFSALGGPVRLVVVTGQARGVPGPRQQGVLGEEMSGPDRRQKCCRGKRKNRGRRSWQLLAFIKLAISNGSE